MAGFFLEKLFSKLYSVAILAKMRTLFKNTVFLSIGNGFTILRRHNCTPP